MDDSEASEEETLAPPKTDIDWEEYLNSLQGEDKDEAESILDDTNAKIDGILDQMVDTKKIGESTLGELKSQGKRLKGIDATLDEIRQNNYESKRNIRSIKSVFGTLFNKVFNCACLRPQGDEWEQADKMPPKPESTDLNIDGPIAEGTSTTTPAFDKYKRSERGLDAIHGMTLELDWLARAMNKEITAQNKNLDRMLDKADEALAEMRKLTASANHTL